MADLYDVLDAAVVIRPERELYDVLDQVVDANKPALHELVVYCTKLLEGPMPPGAWERLSTALEEIESQQNRG